MRLVISLVLLLLSGSAAAGQATSMPSRGERVYFRDGRYRVEGTLVALADSLIIETVNGDSVVRPRPAEIFRHAGRRPAAERFLRGSLIGGLSGMGVGAVIGYADGDDEETMFFSYSAEEKALLGGATLGVVGFVAGGIIGLAASGHRWQRVPLRPTVGAFDTGSGDRLVLGLEAAF